MKVYTNKYLTYNTFGLIYSYLKQSESIMKIENKIYIPLIINNIYNYKNKINIKINPTLYIPNSINNYLTKFVYFDPKSYDLVREDELIKIKLVFENNKKNILLPNNIEVGDIILVEDTDKFNGIY